MVLFVGREAAGLVQDRHGDDALADVMPARRHFDQAARLLVHAESLGDLARHRADAEHVVAGGVVIQFAANAAASRNSALDLASTPDSSCDISSSLCSASAAEYRAFHSRSRSLEVPLVVHLQQGGAHATVDRHDLVHVERRDVWLAGKLIPAARRRAGPRATAPQGHVARLPPFSSAVSGRCRSHPPRPRPCLLRREPYSSPREHLMLRQSALRCALSPAPFRTDALQ